MEQQRKQLITVFGNPVEPKDSLAVRLVPELEKRFKNIEFRIEDPTESLESAGDLWIILDVAEGIDEVTVIEDLKDLEPVRGDSVHDFDVYMELRLREKLGQLPRMKIVLIPYEWERAQAYLALESALRDIISCKI